MAVIRTLIGNVKGVKGDTGATGAQGNAGEITVGSVTTGAYGTPASVVNSGTATNAILDFTIPQGAPGASVTDASPLAANSITTSIEQYPTYTAGETIATILGKIAKFLSDIRTNGLFKSNLVNGFTQTTAGVNALDAKAGKTLNDALSNTNTDLTNLLGNRNYGIRTRTVGTLTITNSLGEEDFSDVFSSIYYAIATVSNTSSGQIIVSTTYSGTTVRVRCVPRSNMTDNANNATPAVRFLVIGTLK